MLFYLTAPTGAERMVNMTISQIRDLLIEEYVETEASIDQMDAVSEGDQFPLEDLTMFEILKSMLEICSEEQTAAVRAKVIAARHHKMVEDYSLPF